MTTANTGLRDDVVWLIYHIHDGKGGFGDEVADLMSQGKPPRGFQYELALTLISKRLAGKRRTPLFEAVRHGVKQRFERAFGCRSESLLEQNPVAEYKAWLEAKLAIERAVRNTERTFPWD